MRLRLAGKLKSSLKRKTIVLKVYQTGNKVKGTPDQQIDGKPIPNRVVDKASGNSFIGKDNGVAGDRSWVKVIAPSVADNSFHWGVNIKDEEAKATDDDKNNI